ncbi:22038_t:CDS:2 [Gigaspora margarita]|uniref:22038_t:CDS:1 n=1 Tax=Gigaspora margarita TaxID=4874 RepID=A0ABN7UJQ9_GIGMA|nr:22038_t:CDS:2 [Gigaspora margarita]
MEAIKMRSKDGNIIIFGGGKNSVQTYPDLAVLNTNAWLWSVPSVSTINAPPSLTRHSANLYKIFMIIAFETYSWVSSLNEVNQGSPTNSDRDPTNKDGTSTNQSDLSSGNVNSSTYKIILYVVISIGCIAFLSGLVVCYKKCYKNRANIEKILTPGDSHNYNLHDKENHNNRVA